MIASSIAVRRATEADVQRLYDWVNAPDSLAQKEATRARISWPEHRAWLKQRLADPESFLMIVEWEGEAVGQVRLERRGDEHVVDIYITPAVRRRRLGRTALAEALAASGVTTAVARVKAANRASRRLFESAGFAVVGHEGEMTIYRLDRAAAPHG